MEYEIKQADKFRFIEEGEGEPLVLLHGLFGALSNFAELIEYFRKHYKVIVPMLPLFELDILHTSVGGLEKPPGASWYGPRYMQTESGYIYEPGGWTGPPSSGTLPGESRPGESRAAFH